MTLEHNALLLTCLGIKGLVLTTIDRTRVDLMNLYIEEVCLLFFDLDADCCLILL